MNNQIFFGVFLLALFGSIQSSSLSAKENEAVVDKDDKEVDVGSQANHQRHLCKFPFTYKNETFNDCTAKDSKKKDATWCKISDEFKDSDLGSNNRKTWGYCHSEVVARTDDGTKCLFPFVHNGKQHLECIKEDSNKEDSNKENPKRWCAISEDFKDKELEKKDITWGYCQEEFVVKPFYKMERCLETFNYNGKTYYGCTTDDSPLHDEAWCATSKHFTSLDDPNTWGYCQLFNKGDNPRSFATCSLNACVDDGTPKTQNGCDDNPIQTVTFDDGNLKFASIDKCEVMLAQSKEKFGIKNEYSGFEAKAKTKYDKKGKLTYIDRIDIIIYYGDRKAMVVVSFRSLPYKGQVLVNHMPVPLSDLHIDKNYNVHGHETLTIKYNDKNGLNTVCLEIHDQMLVCYRLIGAPVAKHTNLMVIKESLKGKMDGYCGNVNGLKVDDYHSKFLNDENSTIIFQRDGVDTKTKREIVNSFFIGSCEQDMSLVQTERYEKKDESD